MKKIFITASALILAVSLMASCSGKKDPDVKDETKPSVTTARDGFEDITSPPENTSDSSDIPDDSTADDNFTSADAVAAARAWLGEADEDTGFKFSYSFDEMINEGGREYYKVRVSWYIEEEERYSLYCYLLVGEDGSVREYNW